MSEDRLPIIERFTLETLEDILQVAAEDNVPSLGIAVVGALAPGAKVYVDGEVRGDYVDTDIDVDYYIDYATGEEHSVYGTRRVHGQKILK